MIAEQLCLLLYSTRWQLECCLALGRETSSANQIKCWTHLLWWECRLFSAVVVADYYLLRNDHQTHCCSKRNESFKATTFSSFLSSSSQWFMPPSSLFHLLWKKTVWFVYFSSSNPEKVILAVGSVKTKDQVSAVTRGLVLTFILLTYQKHF